MKMVLWGCIVIRCWVGFGLWLIFYSFSEVISRLYEILKIVLFEMLDSFPGPSLSLKLPKYLKTHSFLQQVKKSSKFLMLEINSCPVAECSSTELLKSLSRDAH